ncbi:MAG: DUF3011 domain-containing protein [Alphaproteobacteria bacterium]
MGPRKSQRRAVPVALVVALGGLLAGCGAASWIGLGEPGAARDGARRTGGGDLVVRCESRDGTYQTCPAETAGGVRLVRQLSSIRCEENRSWGVEEGQIWVDFGCGGDFQLVGTAPPEPVAAATPALTQPASTALALQFGSPARDEAVRACATYADFKVRDAGADSGRPDRVVYLRRVDERHYQVQAYIRVAYSPDFLRQMEREQKPEPREVFYIDCETLRGQVIHFEYNNFL